MNKIMFDILIGLSEGDKFDSRRFSQIQYKPESIILAEYRHLDSEGFIVDGGISQKGLDCLRSHEINNAIILAAGTSSRFVPHSLEMPKGLLSVKSEILIERQIRQLKEKGFSNIVIVVGYMKEKFDYLRDKYGVVIIETDDFRIRNNHASVYAARDYLGNSIITSSDLYFAENIFQKYAFDSFYCAVYKEGRTPERGIDTDAYDKITRTYYGASNTWVTLGFACFSADFSRKYINIATMEWNNPNVLNKFWADIQDEHLHELPMYAKKIAPEIIFEFDSLQELREFDHEYIADAKSSVIRELAAKLDAKESDLLGFMPIVREDSNRGFMFSSHCKEYICRTDENLRVLSVNRFDDKLQNLVNAVDGFNCYHTASLPLCAAENVVSDFGNLPLSMGFQERYIVGNTHSFTEENNFVGSEHLLPIYDMISNECREIFGSRFTDARTLTGMNCLTTLLMSIAKHGDRILLLNSDSGGHVSIPPICERLGLAVDAIPYNYEKYDLDYEALNERLSAGDIDFLLVAPSDIIKPMDVDKIELGDAVLLYDATQLLGLIGAGLIENPLQKIDRSVLFGGTHKTLPGPASGLIMTNNIGLHAKIERSINPTYIRNTQMHQKMSLLFSLIEFSTFGYAYEEHIVSLANALGRALENEGFEIAKTGGAFSHTHQVFIKTDEQTMERIFSNANRFGITLNKKVKRLFSGFGIRLGTQEIARYNWPVDSMPSVAKIIKLTSLPDIQGAEISDMISGLPGKQIQFAFGSGAMAKFTKYLKHGNGI